jgi:hypothetical protein
MSSPDIAPQASPLGRDGVHDLSADRIQRAIRAVRAIGLLTFLALAREHGLRKCITFAAQNIRHIIAHHLALRWDRRYGVDTAGSIQLHSLSIAGPNRNFGNECVCTSPQSFEFMMRSLPLDLSDTTFIDIGAGKSRTLLLASRCNFVRIVGVEFARELVECSRRNIAAFRSEWQQCHDLEIVEADATQFAFPPTPLVIYFYNPFTRAVFDNVLDNIVASLKTKPRDCRIIYCSSSHNAIDWARPAILARGLFAEVRGEPMPLFFDAVRTVQFAVFRAK